MYSKIAADHFHHPRHVGTLENADAIGRSGMPGQGPFMVLYLRIGEGLVDEARFQTYGCPAAIACGSWVSEWVVGKSVQEASALTAGAVEAGLNGLPLGKEHCAVLAVGTLSDALCGGSVPK